MPRDIVCISVVMVKLLRPVRPLGCAKRRNGMSPVKGNEEVRNSFIIHFKKALTKPAVGLGRVLKYFFCSLLYVRTIRSRN